MSFAPYPPASVLVPAAALIALAPLMPQTIRRIWSASVAAGLIAFWLIAKEFNARGGEGSPFDPTLVIAIVSVAHFVIAQIIRLAWRGTSRPRAANDE